MLKTLSALIHTLTGRGRDAAPPDDRQLLAASLIIDCAVVDGKTTAEERDLLLQMVETYTGLDGAEAEDFLRMAEQRAAEEGDFAAVAADLRHSLPEEQRRLVVSLMWRIALADGSIHEFEEDLIERATALLGIAPEEGRKLREPAAGS